MSGFDSARAAEYDKTAKKSIIGYEALYEIVMAVLAGHPKERVLVLGAGTGKEAILLKQLFADVEVVAVDPSEPMLDVARAKIEAAGLEIDVRCGRLEDFEDLTGLDAVVMIGGLHHLSGPPEQKALLTRLKSCLRPNGLLILGCHVGPLSDPIRARTWEQQWRDMGANDIEIAERRLKIREIAALDPRDLSLWLSQAGFWHNERFFQSLFFEVWGCVGGEVESASTKI